MYLSSEFNQRTAIIQALRALKEIGVHPDDVDVFSDEPLELPHTALLRHSHMSLAVVIGAICIGLLVVGFVYYTQQSYPLITGGMPIFSFWATGVVFYELTMLGAILTSVFWFLRESGLLKRKPPAPTYAPGSICLRMKCPSAREQELRQMLETAGGTNLRTEESPK